MATPAKKSQGPRREFLGIPMLSENLDPNLLVSPPCRRPGWSPAPKTAKSTKVTPKTRVRPQTSSPSPAKDNIFVTPKKKKAFAALHTGLDSAKRLQGVPAVVAAEENSYSPNGGTKSLDKKPEIEDLEGSSKARAMRRLILEEAMSDVPEQGAGRVMYLVKTFERVLSIPKEAAWESSEVKRKVVNWALPGLQFRPEAMLSDLSFSPVSSPRELLAVEDSEGDCTEHSSLNSKGNRLRCETDESEEGRTSWGISISSSGRSRNKRLKVKILQPFKLRTEQRGKFKEQPIKKVKEMLFDEERKRNPIAQGLPWTTDEPEIPKKPPAKEPTEPIDLILRSDVHAVKRAEFDVHVSERTSFIEQIKMERARQQKGTKIMGVHEIYYRRTCSLKKKKSKRFRRELVPKALPTPNFDRPFVPKKSVTVVDFLSKDLTYFI